MDIRILTEVPKSPPPSANECAVSIEIPIDKSAAAGDHSSVSHEVGIVWFHGRNF